MASSYTAEQIDDVEVNLRELVKKFPALGLALKNKNEMAAKMLEKVFAKCTRMKHFKLQPSHPIDRILRSLDPPVFERLQSIEMYNEHDALFAEEETIEIIPERSPLLFVQSWHDCSLMVVKYRHNNQSLNALDLVLAATETWNRPVYLQARVYLYDLVSCKEFPSVHTLDLSDAIYVSGGFFPSMYEKCPHLVSLFLTNCNLGSLDLIRLMEASSEGRFAKLSTLEISQNPGIGGNLSVLLCGHFPSLHTLILSNCELNELDFQSLDRVRRQGRLPQLTNLDVSFNITSELQRSKIFSTLLHWGTPGFNILVRRCCRLECKQLHRLCQQPRRCLLGLRTLYISVNPRISVYVLMCHDFPQLNILILRKCELNAKDLSSLAQAINLGLLADLRHLDLSLNRLTLVYQH